MSTRSEKEKTLNNINSLEELKYFLENLLITKGRKSLMQSVVNSKTLKSLCEKHTQELKDITYSQRVWHILNNIFEIPKCKHCNTNIVNFDRVNFKYLDCCSLSCANHFNKEKIVKTNIERYGVDNIFKSTTIRTKSKKTMVERYGAEHNSQSVVLQNKYKENNLEKYGVEYSIQRPEVKEKIKKTIKEKYNVDFVSQIPGVKEKTQQTILSRFGKHYMQIKEFSDNVLFKRKITWLEKYGCENPMQNSEIINKAHNNCYKIKKYIMPSGKEVKVQGYEPKAINFLLANNYSECDIIIGAKDIESYTGKIYYKTSDEKLHRYFPDIYIISENKIIEVKSDYTYYKNLEISLLKEEACINNGINFEFMIF